MAKKTVLSLFESKGGITIDEAKLSAPLARKIEELDAMLLVLDHLKRELSGLSKEGKQYRLLFLVSLGPAVLGLILGVTGLVEGILGILQVAVSLTAAIGLFAVEFFVLGYQKTTRAAIVQKNKQVQSLSTDLEVRLDNLYDEVLAELYPVPRPSTFGKRPATARQHAKRGEDSA